VPDAPLPLLFTLNVVLSEFIAVWELHGLYELPVSNV
jgi:hypothetical protein